MQMQVQGRRYQRDGKVYPKALTSYLQATDIFQDLSLEEIEAIHGYIPMSRCREGTVFYRQGEVGEQLFILKEGTVNLYRLTPDGQKLVVAIVGAGTIFGEMALAGQSMRDCFAEAKDDVLVCTVTQRQMEHLLRERPEVAMRLLNIMGRQIQQLEERLEQMAYGSVRQRLVRFLLTQPRPAQDGCEVRGFTHEQMGEAIGAMRQTVTRELRQLADEGLLKIGRKRIWLLNVSTLRLELH